MEPIEVRGVKVYPVAFKHHAEFMRVSESVVSLITALGEQVDAQRVIRLASTTVTPKLLDLVDACCVPKLSTMGPMGAPPDVVAEAVAAWWEVNFGTEERARPLIAAVGGAAKAVGISIDTETAYSQMQSLLVSVRQLCSLSFAPTGPTPGSASGKSSTSPGSDAEPAQPESGS